MESALVEEEIQIHPPPPGALLKQPSLRNVADNYRKNFAEERKLKKGGSRFNLIDVIPQAVEEKSEPRAAPSAAPAVDPQWLQHQYPSAANGNGMAVASTEETKS